MSNTNPIIQSFEIEKLHGYKNVSIVFESIVKVVIAENGAGKTTILSALDAFIRCDFISLKSIQFEKIICTLYGSDEPLILEKKYINQAQVGESNESIQDFLSICDTNEESFYNFISQDFDRDDEDTVKSSYLMREIYSNSPFDWDDIIEKCQEAYNFYSGLIGEEAIKLAKTIKEKLHGIEVLYLPTYRRIEKPKTRRNAVRPRIGFMLGSNRQIKKQKASNINYGLEDVEDRLAEISEDIQRKTNIGYRQLSAKIITDLLSGSANDSSKSPLPKLDNLRMFFSRLGDSNLLSDDSQKRINEIYENPEYPSEDTLRYFLGKLSAVVNETSELEATIEAFVGKVNSYLGDSSDSKTLVYDPTNMRVSVKNDWTGVDVKFDDLSSGEKQVISLLSYVFLYPTNKIVLLDEPELSLSMAWQQKILPDIAASPLCVQLLAITHSPFIFDNEFDSNASSLNITRVNSES